MNGLFTFLFMILLILKLTGTVTWSWWIILIPMYIPIVFLTCALIAAVFALGQYWIRRLNGTY